MNVDWSLLPIAFAGGAMGAAVGGNAAFIFTGFFVLIGVAIAAAGGGRDFISNVAFGPMLGPHITFAGGVAAAAYAAKMGVQESGRDVGRGPAGANRPDVLIAGGAFGIIGFVVQSMLAGSPVGVWTDTIALTVFLSALLARISFGKTGLFGKRPSGGQWLPFQRDWGQLFVLGATLGLVSAYMVKLVGLEKGGDVLGFGVAATCLFFLHTGTTVPVWHHIALPAAIAYSMSGGNLWVGAAGGVGGAICGELYARTFLIHGDTHIDPPAAAIATMTLMLRLVL